MKAILFREIKTFFGSPIGYLVIAIFLLLNGLFLWVFEGDFNIANSGFADLNPFFTLAPWILIFLIPAVTMRSFSDEKKQGTIELLLTKPLTRCFSINYFCFSSHTGLCFCCFKIRFTGRKFRPWHNDWLLFRLIVFGIILYRYRNIYFYIV
jgi:hypothetical protein